MGRPFRVSSWNAPSAGLRLGAFFKLAARLAARLKDQLRCRLDNPIAHIGNAERSLSTIRLRYVDALAQLTSPPKWPADQPHVLPRGLCAEQQTPRAGDTGQAGQGQSAWHQGGSEGVDTRRTASLDDLGATPETGFRHRQE
jgi:hypothetical protein